MTTKVSSLFRTLEELTQGRPQELEKSIEQVREWMGKDRSSRPSGYMNNPKFFSAYTAFHLPVHLPEVFWIFEQNSIRLDSFFNNPIHVRDLGCGPGTLTLSFLLWLQSREKPQPTHIDLVDFSKRALTAAKTLCLATLKDSTKTNVQYFEENLEHHRNVSSKKPCHLLLAGHILNELGNGPRYRDRKLELIHKWSGQVLTGGYLLLIDPPLREPTMDLMAIRDEIALNNVEGDFDWSSLRIVAPCPQGIQRCPMLLQKMGWCYAQPSRDWARAEGLALWDKELEKAAHIRLTHPGFSYLLLKKVDPKIEKEIEQMKPVKSDAYSEIGIAITDGEKIRGKICTSSGLKNADVPFRGAYVEKKLVPLNNNPTKLKS